MRGLATFLAYALLELLLTIWVASLIGWLAVIGLVLVGFIAGVLVMLTAGRNAAAALREASQTGQLPPGQVGDSALLFGAGTLLAVPGFLSDAAGLLLIVPPIRRGLRHLGTRFAATYLRRQGMSVVTTTVDGATVTRVVPGDVIAGDVIRRDTDTPAGTADQNPRDEPPELPTQRER